MGMEDFVKFLGIMSALSVSAQTVTEQMKKRFPSLRLQKDYTNQTEEGKTESDSKNVGIQEHIRHVNVQTFSGINGAILAAFGQIHPLQLLGITPIWSTLKPSYLANLLDYLTAGVLVMYGGPWFNECLDAIRFYKQTLQKQMPIK
jgi:hypothetical protein